MALSIARSIILPLNMVVNEADNISKGYIINSELLCDGKDEIGRLMSVFIICMKEALIDAFNVANSIAIDAKDKAGEISSKNCKLHAET